MGRIILLSAYLIVATLVGCSHAGSAGKPPSGGIIAYSLQMPADLPTAGFFAHDKAGKPEWYSPEKVRSEYAALHQRGWRHCLAELNERWDLDADAPAIQGYSWQNGGYCAGYRACQAKVKAAVTQHGLEAAKQAVREAVGRSN